MINASDSELMLRPDPASWRTLARGHFQNINDRHRALRTQLGLPIERPVVITGHQAGFWHPGILSKYLAADAVGRATSGSAAWIIVDQDSEDPFTIRYPTRTPEGRLGVATTSVRPVGSHGGASGSGAGGPDVADIPLAHQSPKLIEMNAPPATDAVRQGLDRIARALEDHAQAPSASEQVAAALDDLLEPLIPRRPRVFATSLVRTNLFADVLARMRDDPRACVASYDSAVSRHPEAGLRRLVFDETNERYELPLWRLEPGRPRRRVFAEDLPAIPSEQLAPKALLMTALLRAGACDLFIHGLGGELYDRATAEWLSAWAPDLQLCPGSVATATLLLPLAEHTPPSAAQIARAKWQAHRARHDPALLNDPRAGAEKKELAVAIASRPRHSPERADLYRRMHETLGRFRQGHSGELARMDQEARELAERASDAQIATERTWAFPLYPPEMLAELKGRVQRTLGG